LKHSSLFFWNLHLKKSSLRVLNYFVHLNSIRHIQITLFHWILIWIAHIIFLKCCFILKSKSTPNIMIIIIQNCLASSRKSKSWCTWNSSLFILLYILIWSLLMRITSYLLIILQWIFHCRHHRNSIIYIWYIASNNAFVVRCLL
jgi:hypothetical protein